MFVHIGQCVRKQPDTGYWKRPTAPSPQASFSLWQGGWVVAAVKKVAKYDPLRHICEKSFRTAKILGKDDGEER